MSTSNTAGREVLGLDDHTGVALAAGQELAIVFPYQGEEHTATLHASGQVTLDAFCYGSPSSAGKAVTGGEVNGWDRFRYVGADGKTYRLDRLRRLGDGNPVGRPGRPATAAGTLRRLEAARRRANKAAARLDPARTRLAVLEDKAAAARAELAAAQAAWVSLGCTAEEIASMPGKHRRTTS